MIPRRSARGVKKSTLIVFARTSRKQDAAKGIRAYQDRLHLLPFQKIALRW
jgi:hypothetical protein